MHPTRSGYIVEDEHCLVQNTARHVIEVFLITSGHQTEERARAADPINESDAGV